MSSLLIAFLIVLLVPLVAATWRMSLLGLALQGILLAWIAMREDEALSPSALLLLVDFVVIRGVFAPRYLYGILKSRNAPPRKDVIPANLFFWAIAGSVVLVAFRCAGALVHGDATAVTHLGVAATAVLLGFLVLATQNSIFSQIIGVLRIENGIALFELASKHHPPLVVELGISAVYLASVLFIGGFLRKLFFAEAAPEPSHPKATL